MKKILIIIFIVFIPFKVYAQETCELSEEFLNYKDNEKNYNSIPRICKTQINDYKLNKSLITDSYYNSADLGYVTSIKSQGSTNLCWAFSSNAVVESLAKRNLNKTYDLSERHIEYKLTYNAYTNGDINENGFYRPLNGGGNDLFTAVYYFNHYGPILESDMPFKNEYTKIPKSSMPSVNNVLDVGYYRSDFYGYGSCTTKTIYEMKQKILTYGIVDVAIYIDDDFNYLNQNKYFYNSDVESTNHEVVIVGWDDTISANKFKKGTKDGAWIAKNSWGTAFGNQGYFYISYEDLSVCAYQTVFDDVKESKNDYVDTSSHVTATFDYVMNKNELISAIPITNNKTKYINEISLQVAANNSYEVFISVGDYKDNSTWKKLGNGHSDNNELITINFPDYKVTGDYTIIIKLNSNGDVSIPVASHSSYYSTLEKVNYKDAYYYDGFWKNYHDIALNIGGYLMTDLTPVIYIYSSANSSDLGIGLSGDILYEFGNTYIQYSSNVSDLKITIFDSNNQNVTDLFDILNNTIIVKNNIASGKYYIEFEYGDSKVKKEITVKKVINNYKYTISDNKVVLNLGTLDFITVDELKNNLNLSALVMDSTKSFNIVANVPTNSYLFLNNNYYKIILLGELNGDGVINSGDIFAMRKHLLGTSLVGDFKSAADINKDGVINSGDLYSIRKILLS